MFAACVHISDMQGFVTEILSRVDVNDYPRCPVFDTFNRFADGAPSYKAANACSAGISMRCCGATHDITPLVMGALGGAIVLAAYSLVSRRR